MIYGTYTESRNSRYSILYEIFYFLVLFKVDFLN
jgi:hypothetical protein